MKTLTHSKRTRLAPPMILGARTAADLMTSNPVSIRQLATVPEAAAFLAIRGISAAPVIDEAGRPVGVVSSTDILHHEGQRTVYPVGAAQYHEGLERPEFSGDSPWSGARVRDVMTPGVFCVGTETPAANVVEKMLALRVRRLFVVDSDGILIGVISTIDVLRNLRRWGLDGKGHSGG